MPRLSLTARLTIFYTLISAVVLLGLGGLTAMAIQQHFLDLDRAILQDKVHTIQEIGSKSDSIGDMTSRLRDVLHSHEGVYVRILLGEQPIYATSELEIPSGVNPRVGATLAGGFRELLSWQIADQKYLALSGHIRTPGNSGQTLDVRVAVDTRHHAHFIESFQNTMLIYVVIATLLSGFLGWFAANRGLSPLRIMKNRAAVVTSNKLGERMPVEAVPVEMAELAASLNAMLDRLQADFRRLSEFSSDLAHELRTPISNLLTETQVNLSMPRSIEVYQDVLASNSEELQRLARMVSDMLFLAKTENGLALPSIEIIAVEVEVKALFDFYEALASERAVRLELLGIGEVLGDRLMLRRALSNLLSNALRHANLKSDVQVQIDTTPKSTSITVVNQGVAIPPEIQPRLFDRFFRADKSRTSQDSDGAGLGLAITRAIMDAHGGTISVESSSSTTRFSLIFPSHGNSGQGQPETS